MTDTPEAAQAPEVSVDDALSAVYQENNPPEELPEVDETPAPEADGEAVEAEPVEEPAEQVGLPTDLPVELKEHWSTLPEGTRDAIAKSHRELSQKLGQQGREVQGLAPIKEVLAEAMQTMPFMADMQPAEAARQIMETAKIAQKFNTDPVNATLQVIKRYGVADAVRNVLGGAPVQNQITPQQIQQMTHAEFDRMMTERDVTGTVQQFSDGREHWADVADDLPDYIAFVAKRNPEASPADKLSKAYEMALRASGLDKASSETTSPEDVARGNPEQAEAAARAKSVNVVSKPTGKARKLTEDEILRKAYREANAS